MKHFITLLSLLIMFSSFTSCDTDEPGLPPQTEQPSIPEIPVNPNEPNNDNDHPDNSMNNQLKMTIGNTPFYISLENNATAKAFKIQLPMTINMSELNSNEKYYNFTTGLPTASTNPGTIYAGDLMLYGSTTLVLFYKTFSTSYSYTRLGRVENASGLASILGSGNIQVKFQLQ